MKRRFVPKYFKRIVVLSIVFVSTGISFGLNSRLGQLNVSEEIVAAPKDIFISEELIDIIILAESSHNPSAHVKKTGARGLAQITPLAWKDLVRHFPAEYRGLNYRKDIFKPHIGRKAVRDYIIILKQYLKINGRPVTLENVLAAYNWGIGNLNKYGISRAPGTTRRFIGKIKEDFNS